MADFANASRLPAALAWSNRLLQRSSSLETLVAMIAVVVYPGLWFAPPLLPVGAFVLLLISLALLILERESGYWTGRYIAARLVFVAASITAFILSDDQLAVAGGVLTAIAVVGGGVVRDPIRRLNSGVAANLDGVRRFADLLVASRAAHVVVGLCVVAVVAGVPLRSFVLPLAGGVVSAGVAFALAVATLVNRRRSHRARRDAFAALRAMRPVFYLMWDAPSEGHYQVTMWVPYLKRIGLPFAVIVRTKDQLASLARVSDVPIVHCRSMADVDKTIVPSLRTVFYVNTALRNAHYLRFNQLRHVQLNHGDSDKPASASKQFRAYDVNFVAGQAAVERFEHYDVDVAPFQLRIVGRPQVEGVQAPRVGVAEQTVLYAPTWGGFFGDSDFSSLPIGELIVETLLARGCRVVFRPHAFTDQHPLHAAVAERIRQRLHRHAATTGLAHLYGPEAEQKMSIFDCFNASDAMVADVSSIVTDYLFSEKPFAMVSVGRAVSRFVEEFPVARFAYLIDAEGATLDARLSEMLGPDPLQSVRSSGRAHYLGDFPREGYSDQFVQAAREMCVESIQPA